LSSKYFVSSSFEIKNAFLIGLSTIPSNPKRCLFYQISIGFFAVRMIPFFYFSSQTILKIYTLQRYHFFNTIPYFTPIFVM
jgi:hypothetical protein